jgi:hypothetical protein
MPDIQLFNLGNRSNRADISDCESVPCVHRETKLGGRCSASDQRTQRRPSPAGESVLTGVQLDCIGTAFPCEPDLLVHRVDEEAHSHAVIVQPSYRAAYSRSVTRNIEAAFCGNFLALLRNERDFRGFETQCNADHFIRTRRLEIESSSSKRCERFQIRVLYVPAVFAQMRGNAIGAAGEAEGGSFLRTRLDSSARLSQRRDMIDVYRESLMSCSHLDRRLGSQQLSWRPA